MYTPRRKGLWHLPGRLYDLAFSGMFRGLRRQLTQAVEKERLYPWLDVCCGTGDQFRQIAGRSSIPGLRTGSLGKDEQGPNTDSRWAVYGLDKSFGFVRYAAARAPEVFFICGDATRLPFKNGSVRAVTVSFGLHDKKPDARTAMIAEARRVLASDGKLIAVDFENPWNAKSRVGMLFVRAAERLAGNEHYSNGKEFLRRGGLRGFLMESGFVEVSRSDIAAGSLSVVVARVDR